MKHVGLNVAADPLFTISYQGVESGLVICVADDPFDKAPKQYKLRFKAPGKEVSVLGGDGYLPMSRNAEGWIECVISSNQGLLIEAL